MSEVTMIANNESGWAFAETPESVNARLQEQIAALTAQLQQAKDLCERSYVHQSALTAERDRLAEEAASVCADAEAVGYYGDHADSAGVCFRAAYTTAIAERDQLRAALKSVEFCRVDMHSGENRCVNSNCPALQGHKNLEVLTPHAPGCIVGLALDRKA